MEINRLWHSACLLMQRSGRKRAAYCRKHELFYHMGKNCSIQSRKLPLYSRLISIHDNVHIASRVNFVTHDISYQMLNLSEDISKNDFRERVGCIEIMDNVFVGAGTTILYDVKIGSNVIIGAGSVVTKDLESNAIYAGIPARKIGDFSDYVNKYVDSTSYPAELRPVGQKVSKELETFMWKQYNEKRGNGNV